MKAKKILGWTIATSPIWGLFIVVALHKDLWLALDVFGVTAVVAGIIFAGVKMATS